MVSTFYLNPPPLPPPVFVKCLSPFGMLKQNTHRLGGLENIRNVLLTILEARKSMIMARADLMSDEVPLHGSQMTDLALCPHMAHGTRDCFGVSFIRMLIIGGLFHESPIFRTKSLPKTPPPNTTTLRFNR